jgi:DNA polymerase III subunit gamma/tau
MSYLVLARKYRPQTFADVIGQAHITDVLIKAIATGRLHHAYLFCGPRGVGKTSCARILAKSLNCEKGPTVHPCGGCSACKEIANGTSFDVMEIDGASNRSIDDIRTLRENVKFAANTGRFKIYIIDEVHMLTTEAFNALLKTLEEPPPHVKFIFATTEPQKVPATIISRCQRFDFKRVSVQVISDRLRSIAETENIKIDADALFMIAKAAQGSLRDALGILDQISALKDCIEANDVFSILGLVETEHLFAISGALAKKDCAGALNALDVVVEKGKDLKQLLRDLTEHFRNLMIVKIGGISLEKLVDYPKPVKEKLAEQSRFFSVEEILRIISVIINAQDTARVTETLRLPIEIAFATLTYVPTGKAQPTPDSAPAASKPVMPNPITDQPAPSSSVAMVKNKRGQINAPDSGSNDRSVTPGALNFAELVKMWDQLTYEVSRQKMSVATYLQAATPSGVDGNKIVIAFPTSASFHKESLEEVWNIKFVQDIFSQVLKQPVCVKYILADHVAKMKTDPEVDSALNTFNGEVVNLWHQEK